MVNIVKRVFTWTWSAIGRSYPDQGYGRDGQTCPLSLRSNAEASQTRRLDDRPKAKQHRNDYAHLATRHKTGELPRTCINECDHSVLCISFSYPLLSLSHTSHCTPSIILNRAAISFVIANLPPQTKLVLETSTRADIERKPCLIYH